LHEHLQADFLPRMQELLAQGKRVQIKPGGVSMLPTLRPNRDIVILSPLPDVLKKYDVVFYQRKDGQLVLHRIVAAGERYTFLGDNQVLKEPGVAREQMIGIMSGFIRDGKKHSVTSLWYRIYCRLWCGGKAVGQVLKSPKYYIRRALLCLKSKP